MKFLLVTVAVLLGVWLWRSGRRVDAPPSQPPTAPENHPQEMVRCAQCGVHLPLSDAVTGRQGVYCSEAHRSSAES